jgi:YVTN family beta-propeller protein
VVNSVEGTVACIDPETLTVRRTMSVGQAPVGIAADPAGERLYVANRGEGTLSVLAVAGGEAYRLPVGAAPGGVTIHPADPRRLLIANAGSGSLTLADDLLPAGIGASPAVSQHPLVGKILPEFRLPALKTDDIHSSREWSERKYILNFFASW